MKEIIEGALAGSRPGTSVPVECQNSLGDLPESLRPSPERARPAAVLVPLVEHASELRILLTRRTDTLPEHPGQIAFPGGRIEPVDQGPLDAALRETEEEIGLPRHFVRPVGYLPPYLTITGYSVVPVVGFVRPGFVYRPDPIEVAEVFEVPFEFVLDPDNHIRETREFRGHEVSYYVIPWQDAGREYRIWGATAAMLIDFARRVNSAAEKTSV